MEICEYVEDIECRDVDNPDVLFKDIQGQEVCCDLDDGLVCENLYDEGHPCSNYKVKLYCCRYEPCSEAPTTLPSTSVTQTTVSTAVSSSVKPTTG